MDHNIPYNRSRPKGKYKGPPVVHAEDSQPNESIDKRRARDPQALIVTSKRRGYQGRQSNYHQSHSYRNNNNSRYTPNYNNTPRAPPSISHVHPIPPSWNASRAFNTASSSRVPSFTPTHTLTPTATSRDPASPPPAKRRRTNEPVVNIKSESISITSSPAPPSTPAPSIKLEPRTPSPPPLSPPARRQLTSGAKRYFPVPFACTRASASQSQLGAPHDWVAVRRAWAHKEAAKLRALGLKVVKFFFRDDGMVIEWVSGDGEPVWADTLRPVNARAGAVAVQEVIDVDGVDTGPPPSPPHTPAVFVRANAQLAHLAVHRATSSPPIEVLGPTEDRLPLAKDRHAHEEEEQDQLAAYHPATLEDLVAQDVRLAEDVPLTRDKERIGGKRVVGVEVREEEELEEEIEGEGQDETLHRLVVEFLRRYILAFDADRASLGAAYAPDALFSFRSTAFEAPGAWTVQRGAGASGGKPPTMFKLPTLAHHRFAPPGAGKVDVDFDVVVLERVAARGGVGTNVNPSTSGERLPEPATVVAVDGDEEWKEERVRNPTTNGKGKGKGKERERAHDDPPLELLPATVLLSVHGQLVGPGGRPLAVDQSWVLVRNEESASAVRKGGKGVGAGVGAGGGSKEGGAHKNAADADADKPWPLLALSHVMVVRDTPWVRWTGGFGVKRTDKDRRD